MENREKGIYRITITGSIVNFVLLACKFAAGILGHSAAMLADAVHSLSDFITDIIVLLFVKLSSKPQDKEHDYGHGKYETLATAFIGVILFGAGAGIMWNGGSSILTVIRGGQLDKPGYIALGAALLSVICKETLYRYTVSEGKRLDSKAVIAYGCAYGRESVASVVPGVGIGGAILLGDSWRILDPIAAVIVSIFIMKTAVELFIPCMDELLEKSLPDTLENEIISIIMSFPGVSDPHNLRTRRIGNYAAVDVHIRMDGNISLNEAHETSSRMEHKIKELLGKGTYVYIHVEPVKPANK